MKEKEIKNWAELRAKGKARYVLVNGVLAWGLPMFIVMTFFVNNAFEKGFDFAELLFHITVWASAGLLFGFGTWYANEKRYQKAKSSGENRT